jgi:hypothetical protein
MQGMIICSEYSLAADEQLFGTTKQIDRWFLIEHRERWERDPINSLRAEARSAVAGLQLKFPRSRFGLIRQSARKSGRLTGFLALSRESHASLYSFEIDRLEDLTASRFGIGMERRKRPLFLVCTHGIHDRCCAKLGNALYDAMSEIGGEDVWQVSHVGGCRFAPNVVCLPDGVVYGRVPVGDCARVINSHRSGRIECDRLRGRACYAKPVQAAEYFLRTAQRFERLDDLRLAHAEETTGFEWRVIFDAAHSERYEVRVAVDDACAATFKSCSAAEPEPRQRFQLIDCKRLKTEG